MFITVFTTARHLSLYCHYLNIHFNIILQPTPSRFKLSLTIKLTDNCRKKRIVQNIYLIRPRTNNETVIYFVYTHTHTHTHTRTYIHTYIHSQLPLVYVNCPSFFSVRTLGAKSRYFLIHQQPVATYDGTRLQGVSSQTDNKQLCTTGVL